MGKSPNCTHGEERMTPTNGIRAAAVAAAVMAAGLACAAPADAAVSATAARSTTRITSQEQLRAGILAAVSAQTISCGADAGYGVHPMGGYPPPIKPPAAD